MVQHSFLLSPALPSPLICPLPPLPPTAIMNPQHRLDHRGENSKQIYSYVSYSPSQSRMEAVGLWTSDNGLDLTDPLRFSGNRTSPPADSLPPEAVLSISIVNVTTTSFDLQWKVPNLHFGRDVVYNISVKHDQLGRQLTTCVGNTTLTHFSVSGLTPNTIYRVRIDVSTIGGRAQGSPFLISTNPEMEVVGISSTAMITITTLTVVFVLISLVLHWFSYIQAGHVVMRHFSISFLHILLFGSLLCYASIVAFGHSSVACILTPSLLSVGFVLMFGSLFSRSYQVYKIFYSNSFHSQKVTTNDLLLILGCIVMWEVFSLLLWYLLDPPRAVLVEHDGNPFKEHYTCQVRRPWIWAAVQLLPKFLLLAYGGFLAFRTRNVHEWFNEATMIAFSLWNTFLFMLIGIGLLVVLTNPTVRFVCISTCILIIVTTTVGAQFFPKVAAIWHVNMGRETEHAWSATSPDPLVMTPSRRSKKEDSTLGSYYGRYKVEPVPTLPLGSPEKSNTSTASFGEKTVHHHILNSSFKSGRRKTGASPRLRVEQREPVKPTRRPIRRRVSAEPTIRKAHPAPVSKSFHT